MSAETAAESELTGRPAHVRRFIEALDAASEQALSRAGQVELRLRLAGEPVALMFAGDALAGLLAPTFAHLEAASSASPALSVRIWDSESTATRMPSPPWDTTQTRSYGVIEELSGGDLYATVQWPTNALNLVDLRAGRGFFWVRSASKLADHEGTPPLVTMLKAWLARRGVQVVHAAAVGTPEGCVLVSGKNGSGKSSTTLACVPSSLGILGDDYCAVAMGSRPMVFSMYSAAKAHADTLERLPFLEPMVSEPRRRRDGKALLFLHRHLPDRVLPSAPLKALLIPRISPRADSAVRAATTSAGFASLAPSTIAQLPGDYQATFSRLRAIAAAVPTYYLDVGTDPAGIAAAIGSVLSG